MRMALLSAVCVLMALAACGRDEGSAAIENGWIPAAPPGAGVMAGYFELNNASASPLRCSGVSGPDFGAAEIHRTVIEDGQSRMLRDQVIELAPGESVRLAPGGLHLMLFRPARGLAVGDQTVLSLNCGEVTVSARFRIQEPR